MRIIVALGGNALLRRGQPLSVDSQIEKIKLAAEALASIALKHDLVITHGNGPHVGLLACRGRPINAVQLFHSTFCTLKPRA
jgi:carbamate kinase